VEAKYEEYRKQFPQQADQLNRMQSGRLPDGWDKDLPSFPADPKGMATRESSGKTLNALAKKYSWLIGGSADLAKSNKTNLTFDGAGDFYPNQLSRAQHPLRRAGTTPWARSSTA